MVVGRHTPEVGKELDVQDVAQVGIEYPNWVQT
jgi:hypothetical protein